MQAPVDKTFGAESKKEVKQKAPEKAFKKLNDENQPPLKTTENTAEAPAASLHHGQTNRQALQAVQPNLGTRFRCRPIKATENTVKKAEENTNDELGGNENSQISSESHGDGWGLAALIPQMTLSAPDEPITEISRPHNSHTETTSKSRFRSDFCDFSIIGRGGYGCVYKATHKLENKDYAVKIVPSKEEALREARTLSDLHHPNIVRYHTCWEEDSGQELDHSDDSSGSSQSTDDWTGKFLYIQMELCEHKTLKGRIEDWNGGGDTEPLSDDERRKKSLVIVPQILSGVEYIHSESKIHRDLKPDNILFDSEKVKIGDFGLATVHNPSKEKKSDKGTESYMAPEQFGKTYDQKVDIFSLGLIYIELLWKISTGHEKSDVLRDAGCQKFPKGFAEAFEMEMQIIKPMLSEKPAHRPTASHLREKLAQTFNAREIVE